MGLYAEAAGRIDDPVALDILSWTRLRAGRGDWPEYTAFLERNPDWPGLPYLRAQGEPSIPEGADPAAVIAYFDDQPPSRGAGALALALAHQAMGNTGEAEAEAVRAWTTLTMTGEEAGRLRSAFAGVINSGSHHTRPARPPAVGGRGRASARHFPLVPEEWQRLAEARLALRARQPGVNALIDAVPADLADDPGLAYERFLWRVRSGFWDRRVS